MAEEPGGVAVILGMFGGPDEHRLRRVHLVEVRGGAGMGLIMEEHEEVIAGPLGTSNERGVHPLVNPQAADGKGRRAERRWGEEVFKACEHDAAMKQRNRTI
jgi:hypothetical protein